MYVDECRNTVLAIGACCTIWQLQYYTWVSTVPLTHPWQRCTMTTRTKHHSSVVLLGSAPTRHTCYYNLVHEIILKVVFWTPTVGLTSFKIRVGPYGQTEERSPHPRSPDFIWQLITPRGPFRVTKGSAAFVATSVRCESGSTRCNSAYCS